MTTILVPVDFSEASKNAALFAQGITAHINDAHLVFFHVLEPFAAGSDGSPLDVSLSDRQTIAETAMHNLAAESGLQADYSVVVKDGLSLVDKMVEYVTMEGCDLVVMGITGAGKLENILMGSNALKMVRQAVVPVLIVPPNAQFQGMDQVAFATDLKAIDSANPARHLRRVLSWFQPTVKVVHVTEGDESADPAAKEQLSDILGPYSAPLYLIKNDNFLDGLDQFTSHQEIDCIVVISRQHSFLDRLFQQSHTRQLAYHTHIPLLAIPE